MQLIKLSAGMGHAGNFCYPALLEALFVTAVVIGDELALPVSQEGAGMSACPAGGKVVNDSGQGRIRPGTHIHWFYCQPDFIHADHVSSSRINSASLEPSCVGQ